MILLSKELSRLPLLRSLGPEDGQPTAGDEMALEVENVVGGGMDQEKSLG
jgi:hypothetical protein